LLAGQIGVMMGIGTALNPFSLRPSYREVDGLGIAEQAASVWPSPGLRRRIFGREAVR